jgi:hypothetical protein
MAHTVYRLAATDIAPTRDLSPSGTLHAYTDGVGTTVCGLELGRQVRLFPDTLWEERTSGRDCPACADGAKSSG